MVPALARTFSVADIAVIPVVVAQKLMLIVNDEKGTLSHR
jgi:hypothetical protein